MAAQPTAARSRAEQPDLAPRARPLTAVAELAEHGLIDSQDTDALYKVGSQFSIAVTPAMAELIDTGNPADPIARQFIPDQRELQNHDLDVPDPIGDSVHSPLPGIVHRYPDRLLLLPVRVCAVYCRFCFRRESVGPHESAILSQAELGAALDYVRDHKEIWEVILSGGDPLLLSPRRLAALMRELAEIEHVRVVRIHTRMPVADPERIDARLINSLRIDKPVYVLVHTNHPRELTAACLDTCSRMIDAGLILLSQSVLLKGINDDAGTLETLFRRLVENRIKPYYLHHCDRAPGTAHFRTTVEKGQTLMRELRGRLSGLCLPEYVLDIPGGHGKVPAGSQWVDRFNKVTDYRDETHNYPE